MFDVTTIDDAKTYTAAALAKLAGVAPATSMRWLAAHKVPSVPSIGAFKLYSGADIKAALAADGHLPPVIESQREGLRTLKV